LDLREEVTGDSRKVLNEELHKMYSSHCIRMITSRRMKWAGM